jgi:hypothetical protein
MSAAGFDLRPPPPCVTNSDCPKSQLCYMGACVPNQGTCCSDNDCENDTRCTTPESGDGGTCGICISYKNGESNALCAGAGFSAMQFKAPIDQCHWPAAPNVNAQVLSTPLVVDLDGDGIPEVVFAPQANSGPSRLVAIRSKDCSEIYNVAAGLEGFSNIAAADLDGDHKPEIIGLLDNGAPGGGHKIAVFNGQTGALIAQSDQAYQVSGTGFDCSGPAVADLNGDGIPEIIAAGMVVKWQAGKLVTLWNKLVPGATWGTMSLANDMDGDGKLEVVVGTKIFEGMTGTDITPSIMSSLTIGGYPAIGDFNKDGFPDIVYVQSQSMNEQVSVIDVHNNKFLMQPTTVPDGWGGPPTVADFDGDGFPEFGSAGPHNYFVFSLDCLQDPKPGKCKGNTPGVLWQSATKDASSGGTASSVFDFNGDGTAKVVYRDECWLRVYNGPDGKTLFARSITSGTALEMPVVADVNNDGHADLVVPSDNLQGMGYCDDQSPEIGTGEIAGPPTQGIFIMRDPMDRWMPSRGMWNEHTYHITNINDDATLPTHEQKNWTGYNNYRQNVQGAAGAPIPQGDATGRIVVNVDGGDCIKDEKLSAQICNRGSAAMGPMVPGSFYSQDPRTGTPMPLCTGYTMNSLLPGQCGTVTCDWTTPSAKPVDLWFRANDDGSDMQDLAECYGGNDLAFMPNVTCMTTPG